MVAQDPSYRVVYPETVRRGLQALCQRAKRRGLGKKTLAAIQEIDVRLHTDPAEFGEPLFRLKKKEAHLRKGAVSPLLVCYGLYDEERLICVFWIKPMPGSGL